MTPHDLELKQYNDIMDRLERIAVELNKVYSNKRAVPMPKSVEDSVYLCAVWAIDAMDKLKKYGERQQ